MMNKQTIDSEQIEEAKNIAIEELKNLNDEYSYYSYNTEEQQKLEKLLEAAIKFGFSIANERQLKIRRAKSALTRLLCCPFCGAKAEGPYNYTEKTTKDPSWRISCSCWCISMIRKTKREVINDWNKRFCEEPV